MTINFEDETGKALDLPVKEIIEEIVAEALDYEGCPYEAEVSVVLTDNEEIRRLNKEYRTCFHFPCWNILRLPIFPRRRRVMRTALTRRRGS